MKTELITNPKIRVLLNIILLAVLFFVNCKKDKEDPFGEYAKLSPDVWAPQSLTITDVSINEKKLEWTYQVTNIEGFKLDRKISNGTWELEYRVFPKEVRFWNDEDINPDESLIYNYRISAYAGSYTSSYDETSSNVVFPAPDSVTTEKITEKKYKISWKDNSNGEQGYKIDHKIDDGDWEIGYGVVDANQTSFIDTNVFRSANIQYRVYGFYRNFTSEKINVNTFAHLTAPANLQITLNSTTSATLIWQDKSDGEDDFIVEKKYQDGTWAQIASVKTNTFTDSDLIFDTVVFYRVCAHAGQYNSSFAENSISAFLSLPSNFHITKNSITSVTLDWQNNNTLEVGFKIERKTESGSWELLETIINPNYEDNNFELNTLIYYRVCTNAGNYNSNWVEDDFDANIPAPTNLKISLNSLTSCTLNWDYYETGHQGFKIDRKVNQGAWVEEFATLNTNQTSFTDNSVNLNYDVYYYRIYTFFNQYQSTSIMNNTSLEIGITAFGGIVFYLDGNGGGLVCAPSDQSTGSEWGCYGTSISGTSTAVGTGSSNMAKIVAGCSTAGIAARICNDLVLNGYSDWFLPSKDELNLMYQNLYTAGIGGFTSAYYWSSSEYTVTLAWGQTFYNGNQDGNNKSFDFCVRVARAF